MISTVIIAALILLMILLGVRRGAAATLLNLAAIVAASVLTRLLSGVFAQAVYDNMIKATVTQNLQNLVTQNGEQFAVQNSLQALPDSIRGVIGFFAGLFGMNLQDLQGRLVVSNAQSQQLISTIEKPLGDVSVFVLTVLFTIILFIVLLIVFKVFARLALRVFRLPVIRQVDMVLGGFLGAVEGLVLACFLANTLYLILSVTNPSITDNQTIFGGLFHALVIFK